MKLIMMALLVFTLRAIADTQTGDAIKVVAAWIKLIDAAQCDGSWDGAAPFFKERIKKDAWVEMIRSARTPLGALKLRKVEKATFMKSLPGVPDGEYVVIQYVTSFEKKAKAIETITPMKDAAGQWKVSGYYIK